MVAIKGNVPTDSDNGSRVKKSPTDFQLRVYAAVRRIPRGKVASYATIASAIGCRSARVVGQALRLCEDDSVPCHRVVAADLTIGGFGGRNAGAQVKRKRTLLEAEGVAFDRGGKIDPACAIRDSPAARWLGRPVAKKE
jgi:methylated-DNA-[protein]-cysteine S-methyltransferase